MSDLISRCELFNRLATIPAPAEANEFKAKVYEIIQSMETVDVAYFCNGIKCDRCSPECELTRDSHYAAIVVITWRTVTSTKIQSVNISS